MALDTGTPVSSALEAGPDPSVQKVSKPCKPVDLDDGDERIYGGGGDGETGQTFPRQKILITHVGPTVPESACCSALKPVSLAINCESIVNKRFE